MPLTDATGWLHRSERPSAAATAALAPPSRSSGVQRSRSASKQQSSARGAAKATRAAAAARTRSASGEEAGRSLAAGAMVARRVVTAGGLVRSPSRAQKAEATAAGGDSMPAARIDE